MCLLHDGDPFSGKLNIISTLAILLILLLQHVHNLHEVNTQDGIGDSDSSLALIICSPGTHNNTRAGKKEINQVDRETTWGRVDSGEWRDSIAAVEC